MFVSYAQNFEDVMLWRALRHVQRGFYVDVGAQDPVVDSVSRAFYETGWRGIHVEPSARYAQRLREDRPDELVIPAAVAEREGLLPFFEISDTGLSTADAVVAARLGRQGYAAREITVPCITLNSVLDHCRGREIHWLKIDVEGFEQQVVAGWKAPGPLPWIVLVESTAPLTQDDTSAGWQDHLLARGYREVYFDGLNRFYVSAQHAELCEAFRAPPNVFDRFTLSGTASSSFTGALNARIAGLQAQSSHELRAAGDALERLRLESEQRRIDHAALQGELLELQRRFGTLAEELVARQHDVMRVEQQLAERTDQVSRLGEALADAGTRINALRERTAAAEAAYRAIELSRSWRATLPLRLLAEGARRSWRAACTLSVGIVSLPRRVARALVLAALTRARAQPRHKARIARVLSRFPALNARLRSFARSHPNPTTTAVRPAVAATDGSRRATGEAERTVDASVADMRTAISQAVEGWHAGRRVNG